MAASQKVQDIMVNGRIPRMFRGLVPIVTAGRSILWVAGHRVAEEVKVTPETGTTLELALSAMTPEAQGLLRIWEGVNYNTAAQ